jgi:hypothetical protein
MPRIFGGAPCPYGVPIRLMKIRVQFARVRLRGDHGRVHQRLVGRAVEAGSSCTSLAKRDICRQN